MNIDDIPPVPLPPDDLVAACATGDCVLVAGSGISAQAGQPTWREALAQIITTAQQENKLTDAERLLTSLQQGQYSIVEELLDTRLPRPILLDLLQKSFHSPSGQNLPPFFMALRDIAFASVITASWEDLFERTFVSRQPLVTTPWDRENFARLFREGRFVILKLFGDPRQPTAYSFTQDEFRKAINDNPPLSRYLASLFSAKTMLFVGVSSVGIEEYLRLLSRPTSSSRRHFALVPWESGVEIHAERFASRWGIELLIYRASAGHPEVVHFFEGLRERIHARTGLTVPRDTSPPSPILEKLTLTDVGPFRKLELQFSRGWDILLGNNGCGKSTLLKAIALGLCGDDDKAQGVAASLLRLAPDASTGSIELGVGDTTYRTTLVHDTDGIRLRSEQLTPLQAGSWAVLGSPPLRGASSQNPRAPSEDSAPNPRVDDLLPLLRGTVDYRVDSLKQWLVNVQLRSEGGPGMSPEQADRYRRLRDSFFRLMATMTPGLRLEYSHVDKQSWQVMVQTDDGVVPLDLLSQGTRSVLGWLGALLQRVYEIYGDREEPENQPALVLVDEIDAHMHPEWQHKLVPLIKSHFPNLQVIATTHSPLVVGNAEPGEIILLRRDVDAPEQIQVRRLETSFQGWRADQILTGPAFGLNTTLGYKTLALMGAYSALLSKSARTQEDNEQLRALERELDQTIPLSAETEPERAEMEQLQQKLIADVNALPKAQKAAIVRDTEEFIAQLDAEEEAR